MPEKNAVTLLQDGEIHLVDDGDEEKEISDGTYSWKELEEGVVQEKYRALCDFFEGIDETRGMSFLYRMMELVRGHEEKINFARMMYLLSRLEPTEEGPKKEKYRQLSQKMYRWIQSDQDCRQLKTAINLYAYIHRTKGEHRDVDKAEEAIKSLVEESKQKCRGKVNIVTTSKIRNLLAMTADIYNQVLTYTSEKLDDEICGRIEYLRIRFIYECGREPKVKAFVKQAEILEILKEIRQSKKNYLLFSKYMEALIAFHKYYGGKEQ